MNKKIAIIADDLTGANDSGVQLTEKGISTSVFFDLPEDEAMLDSGIVIDTNSRALNRQAAYEVTRQTAQFLKKAGYPHVYKKMDSTLRGHIGTELQAVMEEFEADMAIIAPAFPELGRTTVNGIHYVNGKELAATEAANDPKHPVKESSIPEIITHEIGQPVGLLKITEIEKDTSALQETLETLQQKNIRYLVCDAKTQADLELLARKMATVEKRVIWAGSAGLAEALPEVLGIGQATRQAAFTRADQVMTVCGSLSAVTQRQVAFAKEQPHVTEVKVDTTKILSMNWKNSSSQYVQRCLNGLAAGNDIVLYVPSDEQVRKEVAQKGQALGLTGNEIGEHVSRALGEIVAAVANEDHRLNGLMLTGGDTAKDTTRKLGGIGFHLRKQIEAGIPLGELIGTDRTFTVVTKAGAFGKENSIYRAMQEMKGANINE
ncbi:four-carbon acid sugar kinase family protein [Virgibacillus sp. 179-BFC.A HS]|uniref:Four-carbon acid sugar kinase family protein n=1 Tax=Tigheibacillus jepli TaxID=3035914 RepID=A0ABU5CF88_9BACI|nr:four-carbon acid sugar kinase family protein [Virgibacillus sp. 179-BFC.A HS]MDY0404228.1 four-carbon acid sugar kinase family protein [Virgibacillus sp. 179-BFC.A HS]